MVGDFVVDIALGIIEDEVFVVGDFVSVVGIIEVDIFLFGDFDCDVFVVGDFVSMVGIIEVDITKRNFHFRKRMIPLLLVHSLPNVEIGILTPTIDLTFYPI